MKIMWVNDRWCFGLGNKIIFSLSHWKGTHFLSCDSNVLMNPSRLVLAANLRALFGIRSNSLVPQFLFRNFRGPENVLFDRSVMFFLLRFRKNMQYVRLFQLFSTKVRACHLSWFLPTYPDHHNSGSYWAAACHNFVCFSAKLSCGCFGDPSIRV